MSADEVINTLELVFFRKLSSIGGKSARTSMKSDTIERVVTTSNGAKGKGASEDGEAEEESSAAKENPAEVLTTCALGWTCCWWCWC